MLLQNKIIEIHHWMLSIHAECMFCSIGDHNCPSCGWVAVPYQGFGIVYPIVKAGIHRTIMISFYCFTSEKSFPLLSTHITDHNLLSPNKKGWVSVNASLLPCETTCIPQTQCENRKIDQKLVSAKKEINLQPKLGYFKGPESRKQQWQQEEEQIWTKRLRYRYLSSSHYDNWIAEPSTFHAPLW